MGVFGRVDEVHQWQCHVVCILLVGMVLSAGTSPRGSPARSPLGSPLSARKSAKSPPVFSVQVRPIHNHLGTGMVELKK